MVLPIARAATVFNNSIAFAYDILQAEHDEGDEFLLIAAKQTAQALRDLFTGVASAAPVEPAEPRPEPLARLKSEYRESKRFASGELELSADDKQMHHHGGHIYNWGLAKIMSEGLQDQQKSSSPHSSFSSFS